MSVGLGVIVGSEVDGIAVIVGAWLVDGDPDGCNDIVGSGLGR